MIEIKNKNRYEHLKELLKTTNLILLSGASTTGKSFIVSKIISEDSSVTKLLSVTTREQRNKKDTDYHFVSYSEFEKIDFIQKFQFPKGSNVWYGYSKQELASKLASGKKVIIILAPQVFGFYKSYFKLNCIPFKSVYWKIEIPEMKRRYLDRAGYKRTSDLPDIKDVGPNKVNVQDLIRREEELKYDFTLLNEYDYVVDATELINFDK